MNYKYLYDITCSSTPLEDDCGTLCGGVCCRRDKKNSLGIYLFPGEESMFAGDRDWLEWELHNPSEYDFPYNWESPVHFIKCKGACPRDKRPLACRFFPLAPHLLSDGTLILTYETIRLPYRCPLIYNKIPLREDFIETVALAWQSLLGDPRIFTLVREDSREREKTLRKIPPILWANSRRCISDWSDEL
ncbi:MAG: hypothetical protein ACOY46_01840 [Bacillota bacterium]